MVHLLHKAKSSTSLDSKYSWQNNQLRRKGKLLVGADDQLIVDLLSYFHSSAQRGHSGMAATMKRITAMVYW